jgi:hypothetical protein
VDTYGTSAAGRSATHSDAEGGTWPGADRRVCDPSRAGRPYRSGREICQVTESGGTYYRLDISEPEHDLRACGGWPRYTAPGELDDLLNIPGMDRRCIVASNAAIVRNHAIIGVYSDTKTADLGGARAYCQAEGGTVDGS